MSDSVQVDPRFASVDTIFFIIGAQKSGTTWLHKYCEEHPEICVPVWKEQGYWGVHEGTADIGRRLLRAEDEISGKGARGLLSRLTSLRQSPRSKAIRLALKALRAPGAPHTAYADALLQAKKGATKVVGEISPNYSTLTADTFKQMSELGENVRFVFLMRDPASRFVSAIKHGLRYDFGRTAFDEEALAQRADAMLSAKKVSTAEAKTRYDVTIERLESVVSPDKIGYFFFEDLFQQSQVDAFCDFLGVGRHSGAFDKKVNFDRSPELELSEDQYAEAVEKFSDVYAYVFGRFGDRVPDVWHQSYAMRRCVHG